MLVTFPPYITNLINKANDVYLQKCEIEELKEALEYARLNHLRNKGQFLFFNKSRVENDEINNLTETLLENSKKLEENLDIIKEFIETKNNETLFKAVLSIQEASYMITQTINALNMAKATFKIFSPYPVIDDFIKLSANVINGIHKNNVLVEKLPFLAVLKINIEKEVNRFKENYPEEKELIFNLDKSLSYMEDGIGAINTFIESDDKKDLLNGLNILRIVSCDIYDDLEKIKLYRSKKGYSEDPYLDELLRYSDKFLNNESSLEKFKEIFSLFREHYLNIKTDIEAFKSSVIIRTHIQEKFYPEMDELLNEISDINNQIEKEISGEKIDKDLLYELSEDIKSKFNNLQTKLKEFYEKALEEKDLSEDMETSSLRDTIKGLYNKTIPVSFLQQTLETLNGRTELLNARLASISTEDERILDIQDAMKIRGKALKELEKYVDNRKEVHLLNALELIEESFEPMIGAEEFLSEKEVDKNKIGCFKCGTKNTKGSKNCSKCNSILPFAGIVEEESSIDFTDGSSTPVQEKEHRFPEIKYLEDVTRNVIDGISKPGELKKLLQKIIEKISTNNEQYSKFIKPYLDKHGDDSEFKETAKKLSEIFKNMESASKKMNWYFKKEAKNEYLSEGLEDLLESIDELAEFQDRLKTILEKRKPS